MAFEQKEGNFACFQKTSKAGGQYYNGNVTLNGKTFNVSIFEKVSKRGDKYLSGIIDERTQQPTIEQAPATAKKVDSFEDDFLNDDIPF